VEEVSEVVGAMESMRLREGAKAKPSCGYWRALDCGKMVEMRMEMRETRRLSAMVSERDLAGKITVEGCEMSKKLLLDCLGLLFYLWPENWGLYEQ
jgi:hypothetical protein